jgi:hypothetical protein
MFVGVCVHARNRLSILILCLSECAILCMCAYMPVNKEIDLAGHARLSCDSC